MNFPDLPDWVAWLAQDADGACARKGQAVAVKPLKRQQPRSGAMKLGQSEPPADWTAMLVKRVF